MAKDDVIQDQARNVKERDIRGAQQKQVRFTDDGIKTQYAGIFNIGFGPDEVVFIYGNPSVEPNLVRIDSKVAVSLKTAKRMVLTLGNLIRRYEADHGVIDIAMPNAADSNDK